MSEELTKPIVEDSEEQENWVVAYSEATGHFCGNACGLDW